MNCRKIYKWLMHTAILLQIISLSLGKLSTEENEILKPPEKLSETRKHNKPSLENEDKEETNEIPTDRPNTDASRKTKIDKFIWGMNINEDKVLAVHELTSENEKSVESYMDDSDTFVEITRERISFSKNHFVIGVSSMNEHITFPGIIIIADKHLLANKPTVFPPHRQILSYHANLPGKSNLTFTAMPTFSSYHSKLEKLITEYLEDELTDSNNPPVEFSSESTMVFTQEQLAAALGIEVVGSILESNIKFDAIKAEEEMVLVIRFTQIYYTVSTEFWERPSDLFAPDVTVEYLQRFINETKPPVVVTSVAYGRVIYVKISTSSKDLEAKTILETKLASFSTDLEAASNYTKKLKDLKMEVYVTGGSTAQMDLIEARDLEHVNEIILKYKNLVKDNLAAPVTYATTFLSNYEQATIQSSTSYIETTRTEHKHGIIELKQSGVYIASFAVEWDQITINSTDGKRTATRHRWEGNNRNYLEGYTMEIQLPGNSNNISVVAWVDLLFYWEKVINRHNIPLINKRTFELNGNLFSYGREIIPALE